MGVWGNIYNNTQVALRTHALRLTRLQEQVASGARINRVSQDPADAHQILRLRAQSESLLLYGRNLQDVTRTLELTYTVVQEISNELRSVLEKVEQAARLKRKRGYQYVIEVDGGVNADNAPLVRKAGGQILVAGTAVFKSDDYTRAISALRG